jgi:hypothetical protein
MNVHAQYTITSDSITDGVTSEQFLREQYQWFHKGFQDYKPNSSTIKKIKLHASALSFIAVMGTWCSDSREHIPSFFNVINAAGIKPNQVELIGTLRNKKSTHIDVSKLQIEFVPTIIVFYDGKEIGRIIENTKKSMEHDLLNIIKHK